MNLKRILAAVGQLPQDEVVLKRTLEIAAIHSAALTVVHCVDLPGHDPDLGRRDTLPGQAAIAARDRIGAALTGLGADPAGIEIRIDAGSPAARLIEICRDSAPRLVVMRAHQKVKLAKRILGSTTDRVIAAGTAPVLVLKRPA